MHSLQPLITGLSYSCQIFLADVHTSAMYDPIFRRGFRSMRIASVGTAFPPHRYPQAVITEALKERMQDKLEIPGIMNRRHSNCAVDFPHIMFPLDTFQTLSRFGPHHSL